MHHQAFYVTVAGVVPVLFLALIVQDRVRPDTDDPGFWDMFHPIFASLLLALSEVLALVTVYRGHTVINELWVLCGALAGAGMLLFSDAATHEISAMKDVRLRRRLEFTIGLSFLIVVLYAITVIVKS
ncbi:MAG: hypothetical protein ACJ757_06835 [Gaiellaceae bacterium]